MRYFSSWRTLCLIAPLAFLSGCGGSESETPDATAAAGDEAAEATASKSASAPTEELFPQVVLETTHGRITLELDASRAPDTVRNFLAYVASGHYDGTMFHQVEQGYVMLGGSYSSELQLKPALPPIRNEAENGLKNAKGTIAMARSAEEIDSSTCQFFINLGDNAELDYQSPTPEGFGYCVFGRVVDGWDAIEAIAAVPVRNSDEFPSMPSETVMIRSAKRLR